MSQRHARARRSSPPPRRPCASLSSRAYAQGTEKARRAQRVRHRQTIRAGPRAPSAARAAVRRRRGRHRVYPRLRGVDRLARRVGLPRAGALGVSRARGRAACGAAGRERAAHASRGQHRDVRAHRSARDARSATPARRRARPADRQRPRGDAVDRRARGPYARSRRRSVLAVRRAAVSADRHDRGVDAAHDQRGAQRLSDRHGGATSSASSAFSRSAG